jgi:hypothetical protein
MNKLNPQWLQHFYQHETMEDLQSKLMFSESAAEKHMVDTEIKRREAEHGQTSELPRSG